MKLYEWIKDNTPAKNIRLQIGLDKVNYTYPQTRYFSVFMNGTNITGMVAEALGRRISKAKDTSGSMIVHGGGMDMGFKVQSDLYTAGYQNGFTDMFDPDFYDYLGKRRGGITGRYIAK